MARSAPHARFWAFVAVASAWGWCSATLAQPTTQPATSQPAPTWSAIVVIPDGRPADRAEVAVIKANHWTLETGLTLSKNKTHTDARGKFRLIRPDEQHRLVVLGERGYARLAPGQWREGMKIELTPWGRIEGRMMQGDKPVDFDTVQYSGRFAKQPGQPELRTRHEPVWTDAEGRFVFDKVPAGRFYVSRLGKDNTYSLRGRMCEVEPGKTTKLQLGGQGPSLEGRFRFVGLDKIPDKVFRADIESPLRPDGSRALRIRLELEGDRFRLADVPPGRYVVWINYALPTRTKDAQPEQLIYWGVLDAPKGAAKDVVDVGTIELVQLRPGSDQDHPLQFTGFAEGAVRADLERLAPSLASDLGEGVRVQLLALGAYENGSAQWWTPDGKPTDAVRLGDADLDRTEQTLALMRLETSGQPVKFRSYFMRRSSMHPFGRLGRVGDGPLYLCVVRHPPERRFGDLVVGVRRPEARPGQRYAQARWRDVAMRASVPAKPVTTTRKFGQRLSELQRATNHQTPHTLTTANGATVKLLGVGRLRDDAVELWAPDGKPAAPPIDLRPADLEGRGEVLAVEMIPGKGGISFTDDQYLPHPTTSRRTTMLVHSHVWLMSDLPRDEAGHIHHRLDLMTGAWQTVATFPVKADQPETPINRHGIITIGPIEAKPEGRTEVTIRSKGLGENTDFFAVDRRAVAHKSDGGAHNSHRSLIRFPLPPDRIAAIVLREQQVVPVVFRGVAAEPNADSKPQLRTLPKAKPATQPGAAGPSD